MFISVWAPWHAVPSLWRVIKMTSTNCKCLQKCSLASLGHLAEIKGHVCPSLCLSVGCCFSVQYSAYGLQCFPPQFCELLVQRNHLQGSCCTNGSNLISSLTANLRSTLWQNCLNNPFCRGIVSLFPFKTRIDPFYSLYSTNSGDKAVDFGNGSSWACQAMWGDYRKVIGKITSFK